MLIVDGVEYRSWTPSSEAELEELVEAHSKHIFGEDSLYFAVKTRLRSLGGVGSIPDGYVLNLSKPYGWSIVEVELSSHRIFEHIVPQLNKFVQGIRDPNSRKRIVRALHNGIKGDALTNVFVRKKIGSGEIYRVLSETIDKPPKLVVVIDEKTSELEEACASIPISDKRIVEFRVFERVDAGIKNAFLFEPIIEGPNGGGGKGKGPITPQSEYAMPILESLIEMGGRGRVRDVLDKVYEKMKNRLTSADLELVPSGRDIRWKNHAKFERLSLRIEGYLKTGSPRGIWEISEKGRAYYLKEGKMAFNKNDLGP